MCGERCGQSASVYCCRSHGLFLPVDLARGRDGGAESYADVGLRLAIEFYQAHNDLVALFSFLQRQNSNSRVADLQQRKLPAQRARVFLSFEGDQRIIQALRLPVGLALPPAGGVPSDSIDEFVMSDILRSLISVAAPRARRA